MANPITKPSWHRHRLKPTITRPWTAEEDAEVIAIANCGVNSWAWQTNLPDRSFGEIAERRLELREAGEAGRPTPL
jgi:hypothetical protein